LRRTPAVPALWLSVDVAAGARCRRRGATGRHRFAGRESVAANGPVGRSRPSLRAAVVERSVVVVAGGQTTAPAGQQRRFERRRFRWLQRRSRRRCRKRWLRRRRRQLEQRRRKFATQPAVGCGAERHGGRGARTWALPLTAPLGVGPQRKPAASTAQRKSPTTAPAVGRTVALPARSRRRCCSWFCNERGGVGGLWGKLDFYRLLAELRHRWPSRGSRRGRRRCARDAWGRMRRSRALAETFAIARDRKLAVPECERLRWCRRQWRRWRRRRLAAWGLWRCQRPARRAPRHRRESAAGSITIQHSHRLRRVLRAPSIRGVAPLRGTRGRRGRGRPELDPRRSRALQPHRRGRPGRAVGVVRYVGAWSSHRAVLSAPWRRQRGQPRP